MVIHHPLKLKTVKRITAGSGQRVTWGRQVPSQILAEGRAIKKISSAYPEIRDALQKLDDSKLYWVTPQGIKSRGESVI